MRSERGSPPFDMYESYRMYASISFVAVLIVIGVPLWWKTTEVYRAPLPFSRIESLENIPIKIYTKIQIASEDDKRAVKMSDLLSKELITSDLFDINFEVVSLPKKFDGSYEAIVSVEGGPGTILLIEWPKLEVDVYVTSLRTIFYSSKASPVKISKVLKEWMLSENSLQSTIVAMSKPSASSHDAAGRRRMPPSKAFDISLSVAAPNPDKIKVEWAPKEALEQYIEPFVAELSAIHNFTLKSQWLYFVHLDFTPKQVQDDTELKRHYSLPEDVLPHLITPLEKKLASHISKNPCLNFVLYTPPCEQSPIHIYTKNGSRANGKLDAFLSPRWGGVVIGNPPSEICVPYLNNQQEIPTYNPPTKEIMGYFLSQLRLLLGIQSQMPISGVDIEPLRTVSPRKWEIDALIRMRTVEQVISAKLTLRSIAQLLGEISNIVINDEVGASIYDAVENVESTVEYMKSGRLMDALLSSRKAFLAAEAAFTDPSLLALLYFPDDQKYAVYVPLFLPVMIPVINSFKNIWGWFKGDSKKNDSKTKTE